MSPRTRLAAVATTVLLGMALLAWLFAPATPNPGTPVAPSSTVAAPAVTPWCGAGRQRRFAVSHQSRSFATLQPDDTPAAQRPPGVEVVTTLEGVLVTRCLDAAQPGTVRVGWMLASLGQATVRALDQEVFVPVERAALLSTEMLLDLRPDGALVDMQFSEPNTELGRNILQLLWSDAQVRVSAEREYVTTDDTVQGRVFSDHVAQEDGGKLGVERHRERYTLLRAAEAYGSALPYQLKGEAHIILHAGLVKALESQESLTVAGGKGAPHQESTAVTTLRFLGDDAASARAPSRVGTPVVAGQLAMRPDFEARMLALRVDGLTAEQLQDTLLKFANGGLLPDHNRFLWRATGLLKAHPELLVQMEALFHNAALESRGRQLVLDLLVGTGTPQAQAVLRSVLASRTAQADPNFVMFYQRLGLVAAPDEKTVATAAEHYRSPGPEGRPAAVYSYGAVLGNRLAQGDLLAKGMANAVLKDLHEARTPQEQVLLLMALGNAGVPEQSADIATFASSGDALVRRATANALRKDMDPQVTSVLAGMVSDVETDVQRRALMSLQGRELDAAGWRALTAAVQAGGLGEASFEVLLDVVSTSVHVPEARQVLEALVLLQPPPSIHVLGRAREMLSAYQPQDTQVSPEDLDEPAP